MKKLLIILVCFAMIVGICAQNSSNSDADTLKTFKHGFGINAGFTTGLGLSYYYWPGKNGVQVTFLPLFDKDKATFSAGLTFLRYFAESNETRFYLYLGNHVTNINTTDIIYNVGIGPGIEAGNDPIKVHFSFGYALFEIPNDTKTRPTMEIGFFYMF